MALTIRTLEISGSPIERGRQYGHGAADLIDRALAYYEEAFAQQTGMRWDAVREYAAGWMDVCETGAPHLVEEMAGIAEGAGYDILDILALNVRGEVIYDLGARPKAAQVEPRDENEGCTSFSLTREAAGDGHVYAGQNWDWRAGAADTVMALRVVQDPLPTVIMQVEAGQVGRHGGNSAGIVLNANGLGGRFAADGYGMPQTFIRRMTLDQSELPDAINTLVRTPPHIASNALLTTRDGFSISLEITPTGVEWVYPDEGLLVHGNHYAAAVPPALAGSYRPVSPDSLFRVPRALDGLRSAHVETTTPAVRDVVRAAMSDHMGYPESVCTHPDERRPAVRQWATLISSCVDLTTGDYLLSNGTPCDHPYELLPWNLYDGPGSRHTLKLHPEMEDHS